MKQFSQQLHKKAETAIKLRSVEKRELRERLVAYMEYHPLSTEMATKKSPSVVVPVIQESFTMVKVPFARLFRYGSAVAVVALIIVPFVAEKAVPGDALYSVKVQFNEEIRSTLTFGSFEKVEWETERLNRRIAEARLLASEGRLTEDREFEVAAAVREHTENAKREIEVLRFEDADEATIASIALDTTLEVQATALKGSNDVLATVYDNENLVSSQIGNLIAHAIDESRGVPMETDASSTLPAYNKLMARVEQNTTRIYELQSSLTEVAPAEEMAEVTRRIEDLARTINATAVLSETDEMGARMSLVDALQRSQRLIVFMTELELSKTIDIDTLVPVVFTSEEKQAIIASSTASLGAKTEQISLLLEKVENQEVREKALVGQATVLELSARMSSSTEDFSAFTAFSSDAQIIADDTITLLEQHYISVGAINGQTGLVGGDEQEVASTTQSGQGVDTTVESHETTNDGEGIDGVTTN